MRVEGLLLSFPSIPSHTTTALFAFLSLSGLWIFATFYRQLEPSVEKDTQDRSEATPIILLLDKSHSSPKESSYSPLRQRIDTMTTENEGSSSFTLVFDTTEELQTRLVLLPRVEEEGIGAVVEQSTGFDNPDEICGTVVEALVVNKDDDDKVELRDLEFAEILALLRSATPPVRLELSHDRDDKDDEQDEIGEEAEEEEEEEIPEIKESPVKMEEKSEPVFEEEKKVDPADIGELKKDAEPAGKSASAEENVPSMQHSLTSWASRFSATSVQLATERAQQAMEVAEQRRKAAAAAMASSMSPLRSRAASADSKENTPTLDVGLFIQTSSGAFLPLPKDKQRLSSELRVSNASLLTARRSAAEPCSPTAYSFQWYRSVERANTCNGNATEWVELIGATSRTFQPTAIEVGHQIRCLVTKVQEDESDDDESEPPTAKDDIPSASLETFECVSAAPQLFNGSRQALVNGAQFGGISGLGNAKGRSFRIKVAMMMSKDPETKKTSSTSSLCIYQVSGATSEPIHSEEEPITGVSAIADHESAKGFELILPDDMPESASMVAALATDGRLQLSAPNRFGRESLLLSIGIANYTGEPSALGPASVLFCDPEQKTEEEDALTNDDRDSADQAQNDEDPTDAESVQTPPPVPEKTESSESSASMDDARPDTNEADAQRMKTLVRELNMLRSKLSKKDKAMAELQKQVKSADSEKVKLRNELAKKDVDIKEVKRNLLVAERRMQSQEDDMKRIRSDHTKAVESLNNELEGRAATITDLEKTVRILQNEKAVLTATVEARDGKLAKMAELQTSLEEMKAEAAKTEDLRDQLQQANQKYDALSTQLETGKQREEGLLTELENARGKIHSLEKKIKAESEKAASCRSEFDTHQMKIQKLKAERNSYKQKSDSLSKEMSRVCRQGRTIKDVEKIISDDAARRQEVELLREQKRKALEELNHYRTAFEQSRAAQRLAGIDHETTKMFERNAELERLLSELTEYVSAKEMQLETFKEVNEALQAEITDLHRSLMSKNLGKNDV